MAVATSLSMPVFDSQVAIKVMWGAWLTRAGQLVSGGIVTAIAAPTMAVSIRNTKRLMGAQSAVELEAVYRSSLAVDWVRVLAATPLVLAARRGASKMSHEELVGNLQTFTQEYYDWYSAELKKSEADPEMKSEIDMALYSIMRSAKRALAAEPVSLTRIPEPSVRAFSRFLAATELVAAAVVAVLFAGQPRGAAPETARALVERAVELADDWSRMTTPDLL